MAPMDEALKLVEKLKKAYAAKDTKTAAATLTDLKLRTAIGLTDLDPYVRLILAKTKLKLTAFTSLPPLFTPGPNAKKELLIAREVYEHAVLVSVQMEDMTMFECNFNQLNTFYTDTRQVLPPSQQEYPIMGLNLLRLLVQNRTAEFHTILELVSLEIQKNVYIKHAIMLEQFLMEGAYNKVIAAKTDLPAETYQYFMGLLMDTVREEIANSIEKAYPTLKLQTAVQMLSLPSVAKLEAYAAEREWTIANGSLIFQQEKGAVTADEIPSLHLINQALGYAKELERIV